jgi:hypothetical protein
MRGSQVAYLAGIICGQDGINLGESALSSWMILTNTSCSVSPGAYTSDPSTLT